MVGYIQRNRFVQSRDITAMRNTTPQKLEDFPEELLLQIFRDIHDTPIPAFVKYDLDTSGQTPYPDWTRYHRGTRDIQNVRLTCWKFNRISSEFLIQFVGVDLSAESLARFQEIMGHPALGKGVGMVRIRLPVYDRVLGESLEEYLDKMRFDMQDVPYRDPEVGSLVKVYDKIMLHSPEILPVLAAIEPAHREYRQRCLAQHRLPKLQFIEDIANALKMSRKPLRVEITDENDFIWLHNQSIELATPDNVLYLSWRPRPSTWFELYCVDRNIARTYAWMVPAMLVAFADNRIRIADLHLEISHTTRLDQMTFRHTDYRAIRETMRNLRNFTYESGFRLQDESIGPELCTVLWNCLPSASLQTLKLEMVRLRPLQFPNLTQISITFQEVNAQRLAVVLQSLEPHGVAITLIRCHADKGSWADVLDLLRSKQRQVCLVEPFGREFSIAFLGSPQFPSLAPAEYYNHCIVTAEKYIRGSYDTNPLREMEN